MAVAVPKAAPKAPPKAAPQVAPEVDPDAAETSLQPGRGKRWLFIIGALLVLLAVGGGGAYFFMNKGGAEGAQKAQPKQLVYVPMEMFTVNLRTADQERYLQLNMNLAVVDPATANILKLQMPAIRNRVLLLLSSKGVDELLTREGKEKLAAELATEIRLTIEGPGPTKGLQQVLFSSFVIQ